MVKPLIGISLGAMTSPTSGKPHCRYYLERNYIDRLNEAGAATILIPPTTDVATIAPLIDGWLIPGGDDFNSALWGEELHPAASVESQDRFETEHALWQLIPFNLPVFGICYGCQFINVIQNGSLHQHLPDILGDDKHRGYPVHEYSVVPNSLLNQIVGNTAVGASSHHQAVHQAGNGLNIVAKHEDGTIEAIELTNRPWVVGVQWHPERTESETTDKLFNSFVEAAQKFKVERHR